MRIKYLPFFLLLILGGTFLNAQFPRFRALAFYSEDVEPAHKEFRVPVSRTGCYLKL
jgi:hypothetical protein